jgi:hypothetical protein
MIKRTTLLLFFLAIMFSVSEIWAQSYALWPNAPGAATAPTVSGNVSAQACTFTSNLTANTSYSSSGTNTKTALSYCGLMLSGTWATDYEASKYEQYTISPASGYNLNAISIQLYLGCMNSAGKLKAQIAYSTDGTNFTTIAQNGTSATTGLLLGNATGVMQTTATSWGSTLGFWSSSLNTSVSVSNGGTFFLRIYPYATATYSTYGIGVANVKISGTPQAAGTAPVVSTDSIRSITTSTATAFGTLSNIGSPAITVSGFCWDTSAAPTTSKSHTTDGGVSAGAITGSLTGLLPGTTYHIRAYATNAYQTVYGADSTFTTIASAPVVTTAKITDIGTIDATGGGTVLGSGGAAVTARGVCWSTSANPTTSNSYTSDGTGTGTFTSSLTGLTNGTTYHVRAYATNSIGTSYGGDSTFTTLASLSIPTVTTGTASSITGNSASSGGTVTADGGATVTAKGVCWSTSASPTISGSHTSDGTGLGAFTSSLTGLNAETTYHIRAYATNSVGTAYGADSTFTTLAIYYNKASSDISQLSSWGSAADGTGGAPANFTAAGRTFNLTNNGTLAANLKVGGSGSKLIVGVGTFTIPSGDTLFIDTTSTLTVSSACTLAVSGALNLYTSSYPTLTGSLNVLSGGSYILSNPSTPNSVFGGTFQSGSNIVILGGVPRIPATVGGNVVWNSAGANTFINGNTTIGGNLTVMNGRINNGSGGTGRSLTISGNLIVSGGQYDVQGQPGDSKGAQSTTVSGNVSVSGGRLLASEVGTTAGSGVLNIAGNLSVTGGRIDRIFSGSSIILNGSSSQSITSSVIADSLGSLTINNGSGVSLSSDVALKGTLTLTKGVVTLGSHNFILNGTIGGTVADTAYVDASGTGEFRNVISATPASVTFPVGAGTGSSPVSLTLTSGTISAPAYIGVKVAASKSSHNTSTTDYLNRTWTLTSNGITNPVYSDTLGYKAADVAGTEANVFGGLYTGSAWSSLGVVDITNHRIVGTGLTAFGEITGGAFGAGKVTVKVIPQGFYNGGVLNQSDTVKILLANTSTPYAVVDSAFAILDSVSLTATGTFSAAASGSYYIVVKHRSSVETWSAAGVAFTKGSTVTYDFTSAASQAFGNNETEVATGVFAIYSGDCNQDGYVDPLDLSLVDQDSYNYVSGAALATDVNGDRYVDPLDLSIVDQNSYSYVGIMKPTTAKMISAKERAQTLPYYQKWLKSKKVVK